MQELVQNDKTLDWFSNYCEGMKCGQELKHEDT